MELRAICKIKPNVIGLNSSYPDIIGFIERAHPYWKLTAPECGVQKIILDADQFENGDVKILKFVKDILKGDIVNTIDTVILTNEYPSIEEILEMYQDKIKSEDINGLRESEILELYSVENLTSNLTKCLIQNEYLIELIKNLYYTKSSPNITVEDLVEKNTKNDDMKKYQVPNGFNNISIKSTSITHDVLKKTVDSYGNHVISNKRPSGKQRATNKPTYNWDTIDTPISFTRATDMSQEGFDIPLGENTKPEITN